MRFFATRLARVPFTRLILADQNIIVERFFNNKNVNSKWVSKITAEKLKPNDDVKLTQIMDVVRFKYGIGISLVVA